MTATSTTGGGGSGAGGAGATAGSRARRMLPVALAVAGALMVVLVAGAPKNDGAPLDPSSTGKQGTKALVLLLRDQGASVDVTDAVPGADTPVALLLRDNLDDAQFKGVQDWVSAGGTLVVTDPGSDLAGAAAFQVTDAGRLRPGCGLPALQDVSEIDVPGAPLFDLGATLDKTGQTCFRDRVRGTDRDAAFLVTSHHGRGTVIALGGPDPFVNERLAKRDNSVLAVRLLAPAPGAKVTILQPPRIGEGDKSLTDLVPRRVKMALLQLLVAFLFVCLWRARRLGRPVTEPQAVELAGSELVVAVGNLAQQAGRRGEAATVLRDDLRRTLAERLNLGRDTPIDVVADVAAERTGIDRATVLHALGGDPPASDAALVALAQSTETVHLEITHAP